MASSLNPSTGSHSSMLYPTLIGSVGSIAGVLILIETFFYFGHQGTATATAAMVLGALLVVSPVWALLASHVLQRAAGGRVAATSAPSWTADPAREHLNREVADEVRRQLAAGFSNLTRGEGGRPAPTGQQAVPVGSTAANGRSS